MSVGFPSPSLSAKVGMPGGVVARLRPEDPEFFPEFFAGLVAVVDEAQGTDGTLVAEALVDERGG
jgi:hypothetical protein